MRHVITGGSGFTGTALIRQLLPRGQEIVNLDLRSQPDVALGEATTYIKGDVTKPSDLALIGLRPGDVVYHLAARQFADPVPAFGRDAWFNAVNVEGTRQLVNAMQEGGARNVVFFSTDMTYGKPTSCPVKPTHEQNPLGPYGRSKCAAEKILRGADTIDSTIFRPRLITGPGRLGVLGKLFALIERGLPVPMIGNGSNRYQMVGVEDCTRAALMAVDRNTPKGVFNLGSSNPPLAVHLLHAIIRHAKSRSILIQTPASMVKWALKLMDSVGLTLLYPEQFEIADINIILDTSDTFRILGWEPLANDTEMMTAAYDAYIRAKSS